MILILTVTVLFTILLVPVVKWYIRRQNILRVLSVIPGPPSYPLVGTTYLFMGVARDKLSGVLHKIHREYPIITRTALGPDTQIEIKRAEHIEQILGSGNKHLEKSWGYSFMHGWLGLGLLTSAGSKWHSRRKIITPTFHFSILDGFCEIFADKSKILIEKLDRHADGTGKPIDIYPFITKVALDIIAEAAMGTQINAQGDTENDYVRAVYETAELIIRRVIRPWLYNDFLYSLSADGRKCADRLNVLHGFTTKVIQQRKAERLAISQTLAKKQSTVEEDDGVGKKKRLAFLDLLLQTADSGTPLSDNDIREEVDTFMFEGHDTTTAGIAWSLCLLGLHPEWQDRVHEELEDIFQGSDRVATVQDFNEMKVLDRVIKETLRLYPSVPTIGRTLSEDVHLENGKYKLPAGTTISIEILHLHQDERFFPDSDRFDPDRFLPENTEGRHPYAYLPFSAGARNCIGQKFAVYEEKAVLSAIVRNFKWKTIGKREDIHEVFELILRPVNGIPLVLEKRVK